MKIPDETINWLLTSEVPYIKFNTEILFSKGDQTRKLLLKDDLVKESIDLLNGWDTEILKRHDKPNLLIHRLALLADLGIKADDPGMARIIKKILKNANEKGIPEIQIEIPTNFGGSGKPEKVWLICDFPTILYALLKMGVKNEITAKALKALEKVVSENGYRCVGSLPKFKGPGPKASICPYANLISAKALSEDETSINGKAAEAAVEALLGHWELRTEKKYFMFGIGTDFKKLKFPFVWYNLLHMLEVISRYKKYHADPRFKEMLQVLIDKKDKQFRFKPESMYRIYKGRDFADKKYYSQTITLYALKILKRTGFLF